MQLPSSDLSWFVMRAKAGWETLAQLELQAAGYHAYVPRRRVKNFIRRQRLVVNHSEPLMPGYFFLGENKPIDWGRLHDHSFRHVGRPLRNATGFPLRIPASEVIEISVNETEGLYDETGATKKANHDKLAERFAQGTPIRVGEGPFVGLQGFSDGITANDRIKALIGLFGRMTTVEFGEEQLEVA